MNINSRKIEQFKQKCHYANDQSDAIDYIYNNFKSILNSHAFKRLNKITFLGILSPKYRSITLKNNNRKYSVIDDGTRLDHSIGVALFVVNLCKKLKLNESVLKYATCWALLHDIATWPLSHTGEAAFTRIFKISSNELRKSMILGSSILPKKYLLNDELKRIGVEPKILLLLFEKSNRIENTDLDIIWKLIHSPITPDTLEGMWRSGKVFKMNFPSPFDFENKIHINLFEPFVMKSDYSIILRFWKQKAKLYNKHINNRRMLILESIWSNSIKDYFRGINLKKSLELDEETIINEVLKNGLIKNSSINKYKEPQNYYLKRSTINKKDTNISELENFLRKKNKISYAGKL